MYRVISHYLGYIRHGFVLFQGFCAKVNSMTSTAISDQNANFIVYADKRYAYSYFRFSPLQILLLSSPSKRPSNISKQPASFGIIFIFSTIFPLISTMILNHLVFNRPITRTDLDSREGERNIFLYDCLPNT